MASTISVSLALIGGFVSLFIYGLLLLFIFSDFRSIYTDILFYFQLFQDIGGIIVIIGAVLINLNKKYAWIVIYSGAIFMFISLIIFVIVQCSGNVFIYTIESYTINFIYVVILFFSNGTAFSLVSATLVLVQYE